MKWFRLYSEVLDDPKVQQLHPAMFKHWVNLLCLASQTDEGGMLPDEESIAFRLRVRKSELRKILDTLCAAGLLDRVENSTTHVQLSVHKWSERQRKSDDVSQRVARHRAGNAGNETLQETLPKRTVEEEGDTDKRKSRGEGEKNVTTDKPSPRPPKPLPVPMPDEFDAPVDWAWAELGMPSSVVATEMDKMRDWSLAKAERKVDWQAAARNWLRRAASEGSPRIGSKPNGKPTTTEQVKSAFATYKRDFKPLATELETQGATR